jgi:hypothetical protein
MADTQYAILALVPAVVAGLYFLLHRWRFNAFSHIPSPLKRNLFLGHLAIIGEEQQKLGSASHYGQCASTACTISANDPTDYAFENIWKRNGCPEYLFLDTRPASYPLVLITTHHLAEQLSKSTKQQPYSTTKSPTVQEGLGRLIGRYSLLSEEGEDWKTHRKRFNSGFAPQHVLSLLPVILDKTYTFMKKLDALAASGVATPLEPYLTNVTFDIVRARLQSSCETSANLSRRGWTDW